MSDSPMRAVVVDDEERARRRLIRLLASWPADELCLAGEAGDGAAAVELISRTAPDIVFLDVQLPDMDGLEVLRRLARAPRYVIFTTAYDRYALEAFAVGAVDYLLKPFGERDVARAVSRAMERSAEARFREGYQRLLIALDKPRYLQRIPVTYLKDVLLLPVDEISSLEALDELVSLHLAGKTYSTDMTLAELEQRLDPQRFFRAHRRAIINLQRLLRLEPAEGGRYVAVLADGIRVEVSRSASRKLRALLNI